MSPSTSLPDPTFFLTTLFSTLSSAPEAQQEESHHSTDSPLIPLSAKPTLLTLHSLFPTILLPALDLLDRRLVTRLTLQDESREQAASVDTDERYINNRAIYYVKSNAHHRDGRSRYSRGGDAGVTSYEVRTKAWNCTCAAFAFSAFNRPDTPIYESSYDCEADEGHDPMVNEDNGNDDGMLDVPEHHNDAGGKQGDWRWGGLMLGDGEVPLCKHLLACVLTERWDVARKMIDEREVGREEISGWTAGWGG